MNFSYVYTSIIYFYLIHYFLESWMWFKFGKFRNGTIKVGGNISQRLKV